VGNGRLDLSVEALILEDRWNPCSHKASEQSPARALLSMDTGKGNRMTRYQRSLQIWTLLVSASLERRTYRYGDIAETLGMKGSGVLAQFLGPIMWFCEANKLPPLTVLVVNQDTGLPGDGLTTIENVNQDRESVFRFDWFAIEPPETESFREVDKNTK
jgi:hypothetical protein